MPNDGSLLKDIVGHAVDRMLEHRPEKTVDILAYVNRMGEAQRQTGVFVNQMKNVVAELQETTSTHKAATQNEIQHRTVAEAGVSATKTHVEATERLTTAIWALVRSVNSCTEMNETTANHTIEAMDRFGQRFEEQTKAFNNLTAELLYVPGKI